MDPGSANLRLAPLRVLLRRTDRDFSWIFLFNFHGEPSLPDGDRSVNGRTVRAKWPTLDLMRTVTSRTSNAQTGCAPREQPLMPKKHATCPKSTRQARLLGQSHCLLLTRVVPHCYPGAAATSRRGPSARAQTSRSRGSTSTSCVASAASKIARTRGSSSSYSICRPPWATSLSPASPNSAFLSLTKG